MAEAGDVVDILVGEVDAAIECDLAIDYEDFSVVAVVVVGGEKRGERGEEAGFDAEFAEEFGVVGR